jgi:cell division protein FtsQ
MKNIIEKYKVLIFVGGLVVFIVVGKVIVNDIKKDIRVHRIEVVIEDSTMHNFIDNEEILETLLDSGIVVQGKVYDSVNTKRIENIIRHLSVVKSAESYVTFGGTLYIRVVQRNPIVRIITYDKDTYYIDEDGYLMPFTGKNASRVLVATGKIDAPYALFDKNFNVKHSRMMFNRDTLLQEIYEISKFIYENKFWRNNIEQIYVADENEYHFIPKIGSFLIIFGDINDYKKKFRYLEIFYKDVLPKVGWNYYSKIDLRFKNQIVCKKIK